MINVCMELSPESSNNCSNPDNWARKAVMEIQKTFLKFDYNQFNQENFLKIVSSYGDPEILRILYLSTYRPNYIRTEVLLELMKKNGIRVTEVLSGNSKWKYLKVIHALIRHQKDHDLVFVAFRGHEILPLIKMFARRPVIFDFFVSAYDTLCFDRRIVRPQSLVGKCLKCYDRFLCKISSVVLVDTKIHKEYFEAKFRAHNVDYLYVGCNRELFTPMNIGRCTSKFVVFWYGVANPVHGVDVVLRSAKLLENSGTLFRLVGPVRMKYRHLIEELQLKNVEFVDFIPYEKLPAEINSSDLCLGGHFSDKDKARRTIAGKTFQFLSCQKPTIVGDDVANRELFTDGGLVKFVAMNDPHALAKAILEVKGS